MNSSHTETTLFFFNCTTDLPLSRALSISCGNQTEIEIMLKRRMFLSNLIIRFNNAILGFTISESYSVLPTYYIKSATRTLMFFWLVAKTAFRYSHLVHDAWRHVRLKLSGLLKFGLVIPNRASGYRSNLINNMLKLNSVRWTKNC